MGSSFVSLTEMTIGNEENLTHCFFFFRSVPNGSLQILFSTAASANLLPCWESSWKFTHILMEEFVFSTLLT